MDDNFKKLPLTDRMACIVSLVDVGDVVCDIACDHGYVGLEILKENKAKKVIFSDIKVGPLSQAKDNLIKYCKDIDSVAYDFRIGDGLSIIKDGEKIDTVIIAGIGYDVMVSILEDIDKYDIKTLIVSVHSKVEKFRQYLKEKELDVVIEKVIIDKDTIYYIQKIKLR